MRRATYKGKREELIGHTALVRDVPHDSSYLMAQFDDLEHFGKEPPSLALNWHRFKRKEFTIEPRTALERT